MIMKTHKFILIAMAGLVLNACKKKEEEPDPDWSSSQDQSIANAVWQDIYKQVDEEAQGNGNIGIRSCATVTLNPAGSFPTTLTIDFGTAGCMGTDGRFRKGKVEAEFTGYWRDSLTVVTVTPINYVVDGYSVSGTQTIENKGHIGGFLTYDVQVSNGTIINPSNETFTWNSNVTYTWIEGENTTFASDGVSGVLDDVYTIDGTYNGVNRQGSNYTAQTTTPIRKELSCKWPVSGVLELNPQGLQTRVIDFGSGVCDNDATVSVGRFSAVVQMR